MWLEEATDSVAYRAKIRCVITQCLVHAYHGSNLYYSESKIGRGRVFIHLTLLEYSEDGSKILGKNSHKSPLILAGNFNINFADKKSDRITTFLLEKLNLHMDNDPQESTAKYGTIIDAVFSRCFLFSMFLISVIISP